MVNTHNGGAGGAVGWAGLGSLGIWQYFMIYKRNENFSA